MRKFGAAARSCQPVILGYAEKGDGFCNLGEGLAFVYLLNNTDHSLDLSRWAVLKEPLQPVQQGLRGYGSFPLQVGCTTCFLIAGHTCLGLSGCRPVAREAYGLRKSFSGGYPRTRCGASRLIEMRL